MYTDEAIYQLSYEATDGQPAIGIHTHVSNTEEIARSERFHERSKERRKYLGLPKPFSLKTDSFGYSGVGRISPSNLVPDWEKISCALPENTRQGADSDTIGNRLMPLVHTIGTVLHDLRIVLQQQDRCELTGDKDSSQLMIVELDTLSKANQPYSSPVSARFTPDLLRKIYTQPDMSAGSVRIRDAMVATYRSYNATAPDEDFYVTLNPHISFGYPGDHAGFHAVVEPGSMDIAPRFAAINNDSPLQQVTILAGLATLHDIAMNR